ncbi:MAG: molybdopterin-synthase adenylyltransferase MoeB [Fimbriimonadales bacterium]|nr:molybdopterin-synthase adenylyltransferase MoeB [Fimbriimonadales bacterium]
MAELTDRERLRYARHMIMPEVGRAGQERLKDSSALLIGAGGLGSPAAYYLAAAGFGRLGIVDFDEVDRSNLHRQILHFDSDVGKRKVESAKEKLQNQNPDIRIETLDDRLTSENAMELLAKFDIVIDGTDNFPTRYLVNDACAFLKKPNVHGAIFRFEGQVSVFDVSKGPCYRCLYPDPPPPGEVPSCAEAGVFGVLPGIVGCIQASEAIKIALGLGETLTGKLLAFDALSMDFQTYTVSKNPNCKLCGTNPTVTKLIDYEDFCGMKKSTPMTIPQGTVQQLKEKLAAQNGLTLLDVREPHELEISRIEGALHIPMAQVPFRIKEIDENSEVWIICRTGNRSNQIAGILMQRGFKNVTNVAGGINAWAREIDTSLTEY